MLAKFLFKRLHFQKFSCIYLGAMSWFSIHHWHYKRQWNSNISRQDWCCPIGPIHSMIHASVWKIIFDHGPAHQQVTIISFNSSSRINVVLLSMKYRWTLSQNTIMFSKNAFRKCCLRNGDHFGPVSMSWFDLSSYPSLGSLDVFSSFPPLHPPPRPPPPLPSPQ